MRRLSAGAQTAAERRARENAAKRLQDILPQLEGLRFYIEERQPGSDEAEVKHTRIIVVQRAPAIFEAGCSDRKCNGNHDLTRRVVRALKAGKPTFEGTSVCGGENKEGICTLELSFRAEARYALAEESDAA